MADTSWDAWKNIVYGDVIKKNPIQTGMFGKAQPPQTWLDSPEARNNTQYRQSYMDWVTKMQQSDQSNNNVGYDQIMSQAQNAYNPQNIQKYYDIAQGNINRNAANTGAYVGRQAGAHSTNMLNPSSFILGSIGKSQEPYAAQTGQLQATGAAAQQTGAEGLTNMMYTLNRAKQGDINAANALQMQFMAMQQQQEQFKEKMESEEAGFFDYAGLAAKIAATIFTGGAAAPTLLMGKGIDPGFDYASGVA
jgi:hypothetical protein